MFNPITYFQRVRREKREYKEAKERIHALGADYAFVYDKIEHYMWMHAGGDGMDMVSLLADLADLFVASAAEGVKVLDVTGNDVAAFCDDLLAQARTYQQDWHASLNRDIARHFDKETHE